MILLTTAMIGQATNEGIITMEIVDVDSDDQQMAMQLQMMKGAETIYYYNKDKSLMVNSMMGGMIKVQKITENESENVLLLLDAMGQKMMIESTKQDRDKLIDDKAKTLNDLEVVYDQADTKEILGNKCIKAIVKGKDSPLKFELYIALDLNISNKIVQGLETVDLKGFPLEYTIEMEQLSMTYKATDIKSTLDMTAFDLNKEGYKKMTIEEFQKEMSSFGSMGF